MNWTESLYEEDNQWAEAYQAELEQQAYLKALEAEETRDLLDRGIAFV